MRKLLLGAKHFAIENGDSEINTKHLKLSLQGLKPIELPAYNLLLQALDLSEDELERQEIFTSELLSEVASASRLPYSTKVQAILQLLKLEDYDLSFHVFDLYLDEQSVKGAYREVMTQVAEVKALLNDQVYDQELAVETVTDAVTRMIWSDKADRPSAIFFFLGPPATGKTFLAEQLGKGLQGYAFKTFDMTQYVSEKEGFGLTGLRKGFENAAPGALTSFIKENPKSIIVFDEVEKSHTKVQLGLLKMLASGRINDEFWQEEIDARETIVVLTSNLGSELYTNRQFLEQIKASPHQARDSIIDVIRNEKKIENGIEVTAIPREMLSRLSQGGVVLFNKLTPAGLSRIALSQFNTDKNAFQKRMGIEVTVTQLEALMEMLILSFAPDFDTRAMKSRLVDVVFDPVTDYLQENTSVDVSQLTIKLMPDFIHFLEEQDIEQLARSLEIKHQRVFYDTQVTHSGNSLYLTYSNPRIEKLSRSADFKDASGIQVDLPDVSFVDIAGHEKIKARLKEVLNLVKNSETLRELGEKPPKGMLLYGVPGTGKTLLAKAFANEAQLPFIACSGNDLLDEEFIRKLFARAREYAPALIFIDEIDALPKRGAAGPGADALVNRLLVEIDGFSSGGSDLFIIAATNRKENIDDAILRSGRIDLHYEVPQLDKGARQWFIQNMIKKPIFSSDINVDRLVMMTAGMSGADLQKLSRESIIFALREGIEELSEEVLIEQVNNMKYGQTLSLEDSKQRLQETAYHEAGHAVISKIVLPQRRIEQITVVARSNFLGMVSYDAEQEHDYSRDFLFGLTCVALAGRIVQRRQFGDKGLDSGASGDLNQAMNYAWMAIAEWGMDDELYNVNVAKLQTLLKSSAYQSLVEERIAHWMKSATEKTEQLVEKNWQAIEQTALAVLDKEILDESELMEIIKAA